MRFTIFSVGAVALVLLSAACSHKPGRAVPTRDELDRRWNMALTLKLTRCDGVPQRYRFMLSPTTVPSDDDLLAAAAALDQCGAPKV